MSWKVLTAIAVGAMAGAWLRYWLGLVVNGITTRLLLGTLLANTLGCFIAGMIVYLSQKFTLDKTMLTALQVGFLGSLTTFSAYISEFMSKLLAGDWLTALMQLMVHLLSGMLGFMVAVWLAKQLW